MGIGSNLGSREENISHALFRIKLLLTDVKVSSFYETKPVGILDQPFFLNAVCSGHTTADPQQLLNGMLEIEKGMGRERTVRWGPRLIDIDVLLFEDLIINEPGLIVPHPEMLKRAFVMVPLNEIGPNLVHPVEKLPISELFKKLEINPGEIRKV